MLGATVHFRVQHCGKSFVVTYSCKEIPAFNSVDVLSTERENESSSAAFGGFPVPSKVKEEKGLLPKGRKSKIISCF